ncbi:hypothetical protein COCON_G00137770 [Conger conger]|uniref:DMAP1-binding domain-containing protein n=1 Tax=Conger conger TaxID=82655 RepID=A0A9Q1DFY0_CONCO|nr:hypothetical protein COCON_G00137770 [Conger conger]
MLGDITQKGYEKKRSKLIGAYLPQLPGVEPPLPQERRAPVTPSSSSRYHRRRSSGSRDERYRSDVHTEAVQAALARHTERKMAVPMPSKRRSLVVQSSMDTYTPPEGSLLPHPPSSQGSPYMDTGSAGFHGSTTSSATSSSSMQGEGTPTSSQGSINMEHWISRAIHGSTTSSATSSSSTHSGGSGAASRLADVMAHTHIGGSGPIAHLSLKRRPAPGAVENGSSLRRSCEFGSDLAWPRSQSEGQYPEKNAPENHLPRLLRLPPISHASPASWGVRTSVCRLSDGPSALPAAVQKPHRGRLGVAKQNHSAPPDVTTYTSEHSLQVERPQVSTAPRAAPKYGNAELMETGDGVPVSSRVSAKIQQLVNTLKRPKRPPLREFFVDDFEELLEVQQPDPNQPKPEGAQMLAMRGEQLGVVTNWPPSLEAALQRWGTISPKAPCLTTMDTNGKPLYILTYGKLWSRSMKVAFNILHKLGTKQEPMVRPGDRPESQINPAGRRDALQSPSANVSPRPGLVESPSSSPTTTRRVHGGVYGCLLAEVVPVPIEVPLTRKDAGSQQIGFLLGSCGVTVALTSDACHKGLPKSPTGEIPQFKGWPKLLWFVTESKHLSKPPRDWFPHIKDANNDGHGLHEPEYKTCKDGSVLGVTVMRIALLTHCQALTQSCGYTEAETIVNVLDFKKDVGLWHGILTSVMNMMHVISIPYSLMKVNPLSWIQKVCQYKAKVACVKSRDMHWALVAHRDQRDISLSSLRMLVVADGSNPWSISSCDAFLNVFQSKGLRPEVICPCASSPEALTVAIRRPTDDSAQPPGRGVLSMQGLSYGVIRVDSEEKLSVLTVQDVGTVMPGALMCVVKPDGVPQLCRTDEIGELCVSSIATGTSYYGLSGMTKNTFEVFPMGQSGAPISEYPFTRTGLLGFVGPGGLVFIAGKMDGLMVVAGRRHNADDIVATALAVEPMKFVYRGRIAVFSISVLHDERIVVVAEQRPDATEEDSFQWMSRVLQAIDGIHQVGVYCLALVPSNTLPKTPLGGIHLSETKQLFLEGSLHPCNVLMCPHTCVINLPKPRQKQPEIGPASVMVGNLVSGKRIAQASGRDLGQMEDNDQARKFLFLSEVLQWRAQTTPDHLLFTLLNSRGTIASSLTCLQLHKRAEKISVMLAERGHLQDGDHVALVYPPGIDLIAAFYGCLYAGCVPITVRPPHPQNIATTLPTVKMIVEVRASERAQFCLRSAARREPPTIPSIPCSALLT